MIMDKDIPQADPGELIIQYTPFLYKIARRYQGILDRYGTNGAISQEDLIQAGRMTIYAAQKKYNPEECAFTTFIFDRILTAMQRTLGITNGKIPDIPEYLDEPLSEDAEESRIDFIPDPSKTAEEAHIEQENHQEVADAVHDAIDRLKNAKQREVITRCWIEGQEKPAAAVEMGINVRSLQSVDMEARHKLRRDKLLQRFYLCLPSFQVGTKRFNTTWTSAVEMEAIWKDEHYPIELARSEQETASY